MEMELQIVGGDPVNRLLVQLFDIGRIGPKERPTFSVMVVPTLVPRANSDEETCLGLNVNGIVAAGGSGELWNISGRVVSSMGFIIGNCVNRLFEGQYNTTTRKGWLKLLSDFS